MARRHSAVGVGEAASRLGYLYLDTRRGFYAPLEAKYWFERGADLGNVEASYRAGRMLRSRMSYEDADFWLTPGPDEAPLEVRTINGAALFPHGHKSEPDFVAAAQRLKFAADGGHGAAAAELADLYIRGEGVEKDLASALSYAERAARSERSAGHVHARRHILPGNGCRR